MKKIGLSYDEVFKRIIIGKLYIRELHFIWQSFILVLKIY